MSFFSDLKVHAQRKNVNNMRPVNKTRYNRSPESKFMTKLSRSTVLDSYNTVVSPKQRTGLGYFYRVTINEGKICCNCEHFWRFALCFQVEFFKVVCGLSNPNPIMQNWTTKEGIKEIRTCIISKLNKCVLSESKYYSNFVWDTAPPICDTMDIYSHLLEKDIYWIFSSFPLLPFL